MLDDTDIMAQFTDCADYAKYSAHCLAHGVDPLPMSTWVPKLGILTAAQTMLPEIPVREAYDKVVQLMREDAVKPRASAGLGDTIAKITKAVGVQPCSGCKERQEKLNKWFPYE
jgi:hypothetical protein